MRTVGSPRRARTVLAVPAHWSSSPAPRSRRARNHGARLTLRHRAASIAGEFVRGPRPLALRTSSWWTKNSLRFGNRRTQPMRKKPGGGPDRIVATSQAKSLTRERSSSSFGEAAPRTGQDEPWCREVVVLAEDEVRSEIARRPRLEEGRCVGTEFVEQVGELCSLDGVEERTGHIAERSQNGPALGRLWAWDAAQERQATADQRARFRLVSAASGGFRSRPRAWSPRGRTRRGGKPGHVHRRSSFVRRGRLPPGRRSRARLALPAISMRRSRLAMMRRSTP